MNPSTAESTGPHRTDSLLTIPNLLCAIRFFGSFLLLGFAWHEMPIAFSWCFLFLAATDWIDGKLAILLDQRSVFGTRFDSIADVTLYSCLLIGALMLRGNALLAEWPWIAAVITSYFVAVIASLYRFGCWPSYHTRMAKTSWLFTMVGAICFLLGWSNWPFRVAMLWVTLANIESLLVTFILPRADINIPSIFAARRIARNHDTSQVPDEA